ncbi:C39 family peptidase [Actimicrobium antarcticum]|uniref:Peptidase C39 domain-containing protein n=1 Tax=Actimicrobium antarcticum TaxID=1051899 RepID=A0ABP7T595_9BURK
MSKRLLSIAVLMASCCGQGTVQAQQSDAQPDASAEPRIGISNAVPGRSFQPVAVRSMTELRFRNLVRQEQDFSCGAAALATLLQNVYGRSISERAVIADMLRNTDPQRAREQGFSLLDMKQYVERIGLRGHGYTVDMASLRAVKIPVIALQDNGRSRHFVVIKKVIGDTVFIADPALGHRQMPLNEFAAGWNRIVFAVVGDGIRPDNALITSARPLAQLQRAGIVTQTLPQQRQYGLLGIDTF